MKKPDYSQTLTQPTRRHTWRFDKGQLQEVLTKYLASEGVKLPTGVTFIWGVEYNNSNGDVVTLAIDERLAIAPSPESESVPGSADRV